MSAPQVIVAGHICLDIIPAFPAGGHLTELLRPGALVEVGPAVLATGGAVSNTGLALHRLGVSTRLMGKIGDDLFGDAIRAVLRRHAPALADGLLVAPGEPTSYTVVVNPPGIDRVFLHCPGANDTFSAADVPHDRLAGARWFHFGYPPIMRRFYADAGGELETLFRQVRAQGLATSLDLARPDPASDAGRADWRAILRRTLPHVTVFLPSFDEVLFMLRRERFDELTAGGDGAPPLDTVLLGDIAAELLDQGAAVVALKLGAHGLYVRTTADAQRLAPLAAARAAVGQSSALGVQSRALPYDCGGALGVQSSGLHAQADSAVLRSSALHPNLAEWTDRELLSPCFEVDVAGTTGCGDCTIAGFLAALLAGQSLEETLTTAVAVGACNVERADATSGVPTWAELTARLRAGWRKRPLPALGPRWHWDATHQVAIHS